MLSSSSLSIIGCMLLEERESLRRKISRISEEKTKSRDRLCEHFRVISKVCDDFLEFEEQQKKLKVYGVVYNEYNIIANDYIRYLNVVETNDIFHYVGMMIYKAFCEIKNIRWFEIKDIDGFEERMKNRESVKISDGVYRLTIFEGDKKCK